MNDNQFKELMEKLEEIKSLLSVTEDVKTEHANKALSGFLLVRKTFFTFLDEQALWKKDNVKNLFDETILKLVNGD